MPTKTQTGLRSSSWIWRWKISQVSRSEFHESSPVAQDSRSERPVLVRKTSSRLGRCSSIELQRRCPARVERAQDLRDGGGALVDVEPQPPSSTVSSLLHVRLRRRAARPPAASAPSRPTVTTSPEISRLSSVGRALGDDLAVVDDRDPVAERVGLVEVVRGEEDGHALVAQPADLVPHVRAALRVEAGGRLVEEDDLRLVDDAERDVDPAALAAGVGLALAVGVLGELEGVQRLGGAPLRLGLADAVHPGLQHQLLAGGRLVPGAAALGHVADAAAHLARVACAGRRRRWWPRRRRARSAWRACAAWWSCRRRWGRGSRRSRPRRPQVDAADRLDGLRLATGAGAERLPQPPGLDDHVSPPSGVGRADRRGAALTRYSVG